MALVPYSETSPFHDPKKLKRRLFSFAGKQIEIQQEWVDDGRGGSSLGFGTTVYDAALALCHYIEDNSELTNNKRVLELGTGTGIVSIVASLLHASTILATDGDQGLLPLISENVKANGAGNVVIQQLLWGDEGHMSNLAPPYDIVLAADIVASPYEQYFDDLVKTLGQVTTSASLFVLAYKQRHFVERKFFAKLRRDFTIELAPDAELHPDFRGRGIQIFLIKRRPTENQQIA